MRFIQSFAVAFAFTTPALGRLVAIRSPVAADLDLYAKVHDRQLFSGISLANFDLTTSKQNEVLFEVPDNLNIGNVGAKVICADCRTWGSIKVSTTGAEKDDDLIGDVVDFFKDPEEAILNAFSVDLKLELDNVGGHFEFDLNANGELSLSIPIFQSLTPLGVAIGNDISIGLVFSVELVFSATAEIDLAAGFDFSFPKNTFITVDPLSGQIKEDGFLDGEIDPLPITVSSGSATFKAALQIKLQAGTTIDLFNTGFDFQLGVFANIIEYVATISSSEKCSPLITELLDVNIGAFAETVISFNFIDIEGAPPIVTTILTIPLPSLCVTKNNKAVSTRAPHITASVGSASRSARATSSIFTSLGSISAEHLSATSTATKTALAGTGTLPSPFNQASKSSTPRLISSLSTAAKVAPSPAASLASSNSNELITSTVYSTDIITLRACASPLINCPKSLASEIVVTNTKVLYTTVCTAGASLPTTLPAALKTALTPSPKSAMLKFGSPVEIKKTKTSLHLIHLATPIVETLYTPAFERLIYTMPPQATKSLSVAGGVKTKAGKWAYAPSSTSKAGLTTDTSLATATGTRVGMVDKRGTVVESNLMSSTHKNTAGPRSWISGVLAVMVAAWAL